MALRRRVFPVLRFGWLVDRGQQTCPLAVDAELCAITLSRDFAIFGSLAALPCLEAPAFLPVCQARFRSMTLRRRVFPVLLFLGALSLSRTGIRISIQQVFYECKSQIVARQHSS